MLDERFWSKVDMRPSPCGCWLWTANKNNKGYGLFRPGGSEGKRLAHRLAFEEANGPIPDGLIVMHACDTPACVNPAHLSVGTKKDNMQDCKAKGRNRYVPSGKPPPVFYGDDHYTRRRPELVRKGEDIGTSKLTKAQVSEIYRRRMSGEAVRSLARAFDMDRATIGDICTGERWTHLLGVNGNPTKDQLLALPAARQPTLLNEDIVRSIRADFASGMMGIEVAKKYGVTKQTASEIRTRKTWAHVV
jgi:DNA invertase Pin-like site-specific DNA recombinase